MALRLDDGDRVQGDFSVAPEAGYTPTGEEQECLKRLEEYVTELVTIKDDGSLRGRELVEQRKSYLEYLRQQAQKLISREITANQLSLLICKYEGAFEERAAYLRDSTFIVRPDPDQQDPKLYVDISYNINPGHTTKEQLDLKRALDKAVTVVKVVLTDKTKKQQIKRYEYIRQLVGIGRVGLMDGNIDLAKITLETFQDEFVAREAQRVKNYYVRRLGAWALLFVILSGICYALILHNWSSSPRPNLTISAGADPNGITFPVVLLHEVRNFFLLASGAALGAWLAFLIRRPTLGFADLMQMDDDLLNPATRVLFTIVLALVIGLVFWTGMVTIKVGNFSTDFEDSAATALLIGAFFGVASRALAMAVTRRAEQCLNTMRFSAPIGVLQPLERRAIIRISYL